MSDLPAVDAAVVDQLIRDIGKAGTGRVVGTFIEETQKRAQRIVASLKQGDLGSLAREAHTLKSGARSFGTPALAKLAEDLEAALTAGDQIAAERLGTAITDRLPSDMAALQSYLDRT